MKHTSGFLALVDECKSRIREISADEVFARMQKASQSKPPVIDFVTMQAPITEQPFPFLLIDVREESEWAKGYLPGAQHLSKGIIECYIENRIPDKTTPLVLYCGGGYRSALAADALQKMGYTDVYSMAGGWRGWNERGFPVTHG